MITLNHLVYDIKNIAYGGISSDDASISDRQIAFWINQYRAVLIEQSMQKDKSTPEAFVQHLECVNLECIDADACCDGESGHKLLRSTQKIPTTIQRAGNNSITSVSSRDHSVSFSETSYFRQRTNRFNKYTGSKVRWYIKDNYLYLINGFVIDKVSVSGIFEDPTEALEFSTCDGSPCFTWDSEYPITSKIAKMVTDMVLQEKIGLALKTPRDDSNDARGNSKPTTDPNAQTQR